MFLFSERCLFSLIIGDTQRHQRNMKLPLDYPRINQFPEWFTVKPEKSYSVVSSNPKLSGKYTGKQLLEGIQVKLSGGEQLVVSMKN